MVRKLFLTWLVLLLAMAGGGPLYGQSQSAPGVVRVKLQPEVASRISHAVLPMQAGGVVATGVAQLDRVHQQVKAVSMRRLFPYSPKHEAKHKAYGLDLWYEISFDAQTCTPAQAGSLYRKVPGVMVAESVRSAKLIGDGKFVTISNKTARHAPKAGTVMPFNDPLLPDQWHYNNDGSIAGTVAGADINAFKGWETETGKGDVLVAIIDGGFQTDHPDLAANTYANEAELNGQAGVDDDGNGYVDDIHGYNFVINSPDINAHSHGTHVAGTVGAVSNNGIGVAGVAGGSGQGGVKMLVCQVFDSRASSSVDGNYAGALVYAADMGASIAQCSWGWAEAGYYEQAVIDAVKYFTKEGGGDKMNGGLCIFATGNASGTGSYYPACMSEVVAVTAMTATKEPAYYSNYGAWADVAAPGGLLDNGERYGVLSTLPNSTYGYNEGTSMACPHVSGVAALVLSKYGNSQFANSTLRTQLTTSVNDLYGQNPEAQGLYGSGYIDAYKALQMGSGAAPQDVTDLRLTPSQDNVLIEWTIPQSDEMTVDHHVIYYSTEPFTNESDLDKLKQVTIDTKFMLSGDAMQYELQGLTPLTTYYIAIKAYNRWGDSSGLSPVLQATTNAGPEVTVSKTSLQLSVDASQGATAQDAFVISNTGQGMLKYDITAATTGVSISASALGQRQSPGTVVPYSGLMGVEKAQARTIVSADYQKEDWPQQMTWAKGIYAYLGDTDTEKPNALAQYFKVDADTWPEGFNLTAVNLQGYGGQDPVIEIYDGSRSISTASLLQTVDYPYFAYGYDLTLGEQIHFAPGGSFWVVAKFDAGQKNPLGAALANQDGISSYSFYSNDNGQTWSTLSAAVKGGSFESVADQLTWHVTAVSKNPDWSQVLNPEPIEGTVRPGEEQTVTMTNNGQQMVNGTYSFKLKVNTNETLNPQHTLDVSMTVKGNKPQLESKQLIDFGDLLVGQQKTLSIELANTGYGPFAGKDGSMYPSYGEIKSSSDQFELPPYMPAIAARSKATIDITFKPTQAGSCSGNITLTDKQGNAYTFTVRGVAAQPARISVTPTEVDFGDMEVGQAAATATVTIKNDGEYPLEYVFPKFSDSTIEGMASTHKYGYTYISNLNGSQDFAYDGNPDLPGAVDITSQFDDNNWQSEPVSLGFQFPFYGKTYDKVYISSHGGVMMHTTDGNISCLVPTASCVPGLGYISAYANSGHLAMGANSSVSYGRRDGKFTVKFSNVLTPSTNGGDEKTPVSFHITLAPDGSVEMYYDDYTPYSVFMEGQGLFAGISDEECDDYFVITDNDMVFNEGSDLYNAFGTGTAIKIMAPAASMVESLSSTSGVVGIGESRDIVITAKAGDNLYAGALENHLTIQSNDPMQPSATVTLKANITGDQLVPQAAVDSAKVDFGRVFRTSVAQRNVLLSNNGKRQMDVTSVSVANGLFSIDSKVAQPFTIEPGQGRDITVTLPTEQEGAVTDQLVITTSGGTFTLPLSGTVAGTPQWQLEPEAITATTPFGQAAQQTLTVTNAGNETLEMSLMPEPWYSLSDATAGEGASVDYVYQAKSDGYDVPFSWVDITGNYDAHQPLSYYLDQTDYYAVDLPFSFPFYGKSYSRMYIYNTGFVQFDEPLTDYKQFPEPPAALPTTDTFYRNIIAPFWGNHSMDTPSTAGTFYKAEDDHVVVSFHEYGNSAMRGMNFQVILFKDGTFKYQYQLDPSGRMLGVYGLCGLQDETGTRGLNPGDQYISSGNAMMFYPVKTTRVAPGETAQVGVGLKADDKAGTFTHTLQIATNVPGSELVEVPVELNVTGETLPVFPDKVVCEAVADPVNWPTLNFNFEVANQGPKPFKITAASYNDDMEYYTALNVYTTYIDSWFGEEVTGWTQFFPGLEVEVGREPVKMQVQVFDQGTPLQATLPIIFTVEGIEGQSTVTVPVEINLTEAPQMQLNRPEIVIDNVAGSYTGQEDLVISNTGQYKLTYSLRLDPSGRDEQAEEEDGGGIGPMAGAYAQADSLAATGVMSRAMAAIEPYDYSSDADRDAYVYDVPKDEQYTNLIYYPMFKPWSAAKSLIMGSGSTTENFYAATRYVAPGEGFNLTDLYFVGTIGDLENVEIEAEVVQGADVATGTVIGRGRLHVDKEDMNQGGYYGEPRMLQFDKPVYVNPADTFYVVLKYPVGYAHSAIMASKDGKKDPGRYMAYIQSMGGWFDAEELIDNQYGYGALGYFMTCVEKQKGQPWITLTPGTATGGELQPGGQVTVSMAVNAASAYTDKGNRATLVIKTNDPNQKLVNYHITLNKNAAPVVTLPGGTTTVAEAQTALLPVTVADEEGEAFTVEVADKSGIATLAGYTIEGEAETTPAEGTATISVPEGKSLTISMKLQPQYGDEGMHTVAITATDASGNTATVEAPYSVEHTNRAPLYVGPSEISLGQGETSAANVFSQMFTDADDDQMTYVATIANQTVAGLYTEQSGFIIQARKKGQTTVTVTATDQNGAATSGTINVSVTDASGIGSATAGGSQRPAVAQQDGKVTLTLPQAVARARVEIYNNAGQTVALLTLDDVEAGSVISLPVDTQPAGVYHLKATLDGKTATLKFVKR